MTSYQGPVDVVRDVLRQPNGQRRRADVNLAGATVEHEPGSFTVRNRTLIGDYDRFYQNFVPGAASADRTSVALTGYNNATARLNLFNQTDVTTRRRPDDCHTRCWLAPTWTSVTDNIRNTGFFSNTLTSICAL